MRIRLSDSVELTVLAVEIPDQIMAIMIDDGPPQELCAATYSFTLHPWVELRPTPLFDAPAHLWPGEDGWTILVQGGQVEPVRAGRQWSIANHKLTATTVPVTATSVTPTAKGYTHLDYLDVEATYTHVHIRRARRSTLTITGNAAKALTELAEIGGSAPWDVVAGEIWKDTPNNREMVRHRWDRMLGRLRELLAEHGIRSNLVVSDGLGNVFLNTLPGDVVSSISL